jgi:hypothetical protein
VADAAHLRQVFERVYNLVLAPPIVFCDRFEQAEVNHTQSWEATMVQFFSGRVSAWSAPSYSFGPEDSRSGADSRARQRRQDASTGGSGTSEVRGVGGH